MNEKEYYKLQGKLEGLREAEKIIAETKQQLITSTELRLAKRVAKLEVQLQAITPHDEVAELKAENSLLKSTLAEIKKHETGCNALKFAIARVRELEDGAREIVENLDAKIIDSSNNMLQKITNGNLKYANQIIKQKFNLE